MSIQNFIKSLLPRFSKDQITEDARITMDELDNIAIPAYEVAAAYFKTQKFISEDNKYLQSMFYRNLTMKYKQNNLMLDISKALVSVRENLAVVINMSEDVLEKDIITDGLTAKKLAIIRSVEHISFISRFSIDLLNCIYSNETAESKTDGIEDLLLTKAQMKHIESNIGSFAVILSSYSEDKKDYTSKINEIPDVILNESTAAAVSSLYKEKDVSPMATALVSNFKGNPIYHVRMMIAGWQSDRYKASKEKKKLLELRLLHLQSRKENESKGMPNAALEKEITYLQNRIDNIENYMRESERKVGME